jgi:hypothetical protein
MQSDNYTPIAAMASMKPVPIGFFAVSTLALALVDAGDVGRVMVVMVASALVTALVTGGLVE